jgi:hypothetical protein
MGITETRNFITHEKKPERRTHEAQDRIGSIMWLSIHPSMALLQFLDL